MQRRASTRVQVQARVKRAVCKLKTYNLPHLKQIIMDKIIIIIALFLFSSCSSQKENQEHNSIYSYADLKEYSTTITRSEDFLALPLEYVELETTDNSLVGYVERIVVNDSLIYIKSDGSLHLFERSGKFRNSIGRVGQGPKEVISIFDFAVDAENQEVYILDLQGQKICLVLILVDWLNLIILI